MQSVESRLNVVVPSFKTRTKPKNTIRDKVKSNQFPKPHYEPRDIDKFNALDLIHLLVWWDEDALSYEDGCLKLVVDKNYIVYSEGVYNKETHQVYNVIDTLKKLYELSFPKACFVANTFKNMTHTFFNDIREYCEAKYPKAKMAKISCDYNYNELLDESLFIQSKSDPFKRAYAVLHNRLHIDRHIVSEFIHRELLIMDDEYNLCFLGRDNYNVISVNKYLSNRDYLSVEESTLRRNAGFRYASTEETAYNLFRNVYVFENVIDLMSYLTLVKMGVMPDIEKASCLISLNGLTNGVLYNFLLEHQEVQTIYACLNNDNAGIRATKSLSQRVMVDMQPYLRDYSLKYGYVKSWNELLSKE